MGDHPFKEDFTERQSREGKYLHEPNRFFSGIKNRYGQGIHLGRGLFESLSSYWLRRMAKRPNKNQGFWFHGYSLFVVLEEFLRVILEILEDNLEILNSVFVEATDKA